MYFSYDTIWPPTQSDPKQIVLVVRVPFMVHVLRE